MEWIGWSDCHVCQSVCCLSVIHVVRCSPHYYTPCHVIVLCCCDGGVLGVLDRQNGDSIGHLLAVIYSLPLSRSLNLLSITSLLPP